MTNPQMKEKCFKLLKLLGNETNSVGFINKYLYKKYVPKERSKDYDDYTVSMNWNIKNDEINMSWYQEHFYKYRGIRDINEGCVKLSNEKEINRAMVSVHHELYIKLINIQKKEILKKRKIFFEKELEKEAKENIKKLI